MIRSGEKASSVTLLDRPRRNPSVEFHTSDITSSKEVVLLNRDNGESYSLGEDETFIWNRLDGNNSLSEIAAALIGTRDDVDEKTVLDFAQQIFDAGLIILPGQAARQAPTKKGDWFFELFSVNADRTARVLAFPFKKIRPSVLAIASVVFVLMVTSIFFKELIDLVSSSSTYMVLGSSMLGFFVYLYLVNLPAAAIHELSHAIASEICGLSPKKFGLGILYLNPVFFTRIDDLIFASRYRRIFIAAAGPWMNISFGLLAFLVSTFAGGGPMNFLLMFSFLSITIGLLNLSPFFRSDGYYILADTLNAPNLGPDAWTYFKNALRGHRIEQSGVTTSRKILAVYVLAGAAWIFIMITTNITWIYQILFGVDGLFQLILNGGSVTLATMFGLLYFLVVLGVIFVQFLRRTNTKQRLARVFQ